MKDEGNVAEGLVEASAECGEDDDLLGVQSQRVLDGEFEIGFIFVFGI